MATLKEEQQRIASERKKLYQKIETVQKDQADLL